MDLCEEIGGCRNLCNVLIRSTLLDSWTWDQLRTMKVGSNANARKFFESHGDAKNKDAKSKYSSRVAMLYREHLERAAEQDRQKYGERVVTEDDDLEMEVPGKHGDFFHESNYASPQLASLGDSSEAKIHKDMYKSSIGKKAVSSSKNIKAGNKMTLGAKKVTINLDELEQKAKEAEIREESKKINDISLE
jgi:ADP-ribosylation factor GTPase-activating protein 2/3